jgi:adenylate cyclase
MVCCQPAPPTRRHHATPTMLSDRRTTPTSGHYPYARNMSVDWQREGMLEGLDAQARAARIELLDLLNSSGVGLEELKRAVGEDRLALLPVERVLAGHPRYTLAEAAELAGVTQEFLGELIDALGLPVPGLDEVLFGEDTVEAARAAGLFRKSGLPQEGLLELTRILGDAMVPVAEGIRRLVGEALLRAGDSEQDLGVRYERAAVDLLPLLRPLPEFVLSLQLREQVRRDVIGAAERASGRLPETVPMAVAFADLVGFTKLGERVPGEELARMAAHLSKLGHELATPPVRVVKTIGDAVMFVSPQASALLEVVLRLADAVEAEGDMPSLRVGVACGDVINRWGDWYGGPVNLASRITEHARPGGVLATKKVRELAPADFSWSRAGSKSFKNVSGRVSLHRPRLHSPASSDAGARNLRSAHAQRIAHVVLRSHAN